jgi:hypothetical protein
VTATFSFWEQPYRCPSQVSIPKDGIVPKRAAKALRKRKLKNADEAALIEDGGTQS